MGGCHIEQHHRRPDNDNPDNHWALQALAVRERRRQVCTPAPDSRARVHSRAGGSCPSWFSQLRLNCALSSSPIVNSTDGDAIPTAESFGFGIVIYLVDPWVKVFDHPDEHRNCAPCIGARVAGDCPKIRCRSAGSWHSPSNRLDRGHHRHGAPRSIHLGPMRHRAPIFLNEKRGHHNPSSV